MHATPPRFHHLICPLQPASSTPPLCPAHDRPAPRLSAVLLAQRVPPRPPLSLHQLEHPGESEKTVLCLHLKESKSHHDNIIFGGVSSSARSPGIIAVVALVLSVDPIRLAVGSKLDLLIDKVRYTNQHAPCSTRSKPKADMKEIPPFTLPTLSQKVLLRILMLRYLGSSGSSRSLVAICVRLSSVFESP